MDYFVIDSAAVPSYSIIANSSLGSFPCLLACLLAYLLACFSYTSGWATTASDPYLHPSGSCPLGSVRILLIPSCYSAVPSYYSIPFLDFASLGSSSSTITAIASSSFSAFASVAIAATAVVAWGSSAAGCSSSCLASKAGSCFVVG